MKTKDKKTLIVYYRLVKGGEVQKLFISYDRFYPTIESINNIIQQTIPNAAQAWFN